MPTFLDTTSQLLLDRPTLTMPDGAVE